MQKLSIKNILNSVLIRNFIDDLMYSKYIKFVLRNYIKNSII